MVCETVCVGWGSVVIVEEGDDTDATEAVEGDAKPGGTDDAKVEVDGCGCSPTEVCVGDVCYPDKRVFASLIQIGDTGTAAISAKTWSGASGQPPTQDGDCTISTTLGAAYDGPALNLGSATLSIDTGPPLSFPPLTDGSAQLDLGMGPTLALTGGQPITIAWSGGADVPPSSISFSTSAPAEIAEVAPMIPGEPWTLSWSAPSHDATLGLSGSDGSFISCSSKGLSIAVPGTVTALVDVSGFPYSQSDATFVLRPSIVDDELDNGVAVSGIGLRSSWIDIPPP